MTEISILRLHIFINGRLFEVEHWPATLIMAQFNLYNLLFHTRLISTTTWFSCPLVVILCITTRVGNQPWKRSHLLPGPYCLPTCFGPYRPDSVG